MRSYINFAHPSTRPRVHASVRPRVHPSTRPPAHHTPPTPRLRSVLHAVQIEVLSSVYTEISQRLNDLENHRTDTSFENALISKNFAFQFVNKYSACFYIGGTPTPFAPFAPTPLTPPTPPTPPTLLTPPAPGR